MKIESSKEIKWNILKRLQRLPYDQIGLVRRLVMHKAACTQSKYYRVIQEKDNDVHVLIALAQVLNCKVDDVITPEYEFQDPQLTKELVNKITQNREKTQEFRIISDGQADS